MLFQFMLTKFFSKVNCFRVYRKLILQSSNAKGLFITLCLQYYYCSIIVLWKLFVMKKV